MASKTNPPTKAKKEGGRVQPKGGMFQPAQIRQFAGEVKSEFDKIAWPDKKHTIGSTAVVVVLVTIISFYLGAVDLILGKLIGLILR